MVQSSREEMFIESKRTLNVLSPWNICRRVDSCVPIKELDNKEAVP